MIWLTFFFLKIFSIEPLFMLAGYRSQMQSHVSRETFFYSCKGCLEPKIGVPKPGELLIEAGQLLIDPGELLIDPGDFISNPGKANRARATANRGRGNANRPSGSQKCHSEYQGRFLFAAAAYLRQGCAVA